MLAASAESSRSGPCTILGETPFDASLCIQREDRVLVLVCGGSTCEAPAKDVTWTAKSRCYPQGGPSKPVSRDAHGETKYFAAIREGRKLIKGKIDGGPIELSLADGFETPAMIGTARGLPVINKIAPQGGVIGVSSFFDLNPVKCPLKKVAANSK